MSDVIKHFMADLKSQYETEFDLKKNIEGKANNMIIVSGIVVPLLFGFGTAFLDKLQQKNTTVTLDEVHTIYGFLILGVVAGIISIALASWSTSKMRDYRYALVHDDFYDTKTKKHKIKAIENELKKTEEQYMKGMIGEYLIAIGENSETNNNKTRFLTCSYIMFLVTIASAVAILSLIAIHTIITGEIITHLPT